MKNTRHASTAWMLALASLAAASSGAVEQAPPPTYSWAPWHAMPWMGWNVTPWPAFGWLLALACWLMMRRGGIGCCRWSGGFGRGEAPGRRAGGRAPTARERLDERYVSGEIGEREYAHMKAQLAAPPSPLPDSRA